MGGGAGDPKIDGMDNYCRVKELVNQLPGCGGALASRPSAKRHPKLYQTLEDYKIQRGTKLERRGFTRDRRQKITAKTLCDRQGTGPLVEACRGSSRCAGNRVRKRKDGTLRQENPWGCQGPGSSSRMAKGGQQDK